MNYLGHNEFGLLHKPWNEPLNYKNISEISVASGVILGSTAKKEYNENYIKYIIKIERSKFQIICSRRHIH